MAFKKYRPDQAGLHEIGLDPKMQQACMEGAGVVAQVANADDPDGAYVAEPVDVNAGYLNEVRAGARVRQTQFSQRGVDRRTLVRAVNG